MAILSNVTRGHKVYLRPQHVFGRDSSADTVLESLEASRLHAIIHWTGIGWEVRDHSRNGTWVDGKRIPTGCAVSVKLGSELILGHGGTLWRFDDVSRPSTVLLPLQWGEPIVLARSNLLPHGVNAELSIVQTGDGRWLCTDHRGTRHLQDGDDVRIGGQVWRFVSDGQDVLTQEAANPMPDLLHFQVSLDEEHVWLQFTHAGRILDLGERTHHYMLLTLARLRAADAQRGLEPTAQGWVEQERLATMLGISTAHLNIQVFRLRKQIALLCDPDAPTLELIERRRGQLRLRELELCVVRGSQVQVRFEPSQSFAQGFEESLAL